MIAVINYGLGNLTSIQNMCKRLNIDAIVTNRPEVIATADKLILPGVGHFQKGMENLREDELKDLLDEQVLQKKKPILGICLGAQLMTRSSEESELKGLGWVDADTVRFDKNKIGDLKIPLMGWQEISIKNGSPLLKDLPETPRFYFVHGYHFRFTDEKEVSATTNYGYEFVCAFRKENIFGTQFHPEKSHKFGMKVLENFAAL